MTVTRTAMTLTELRDAGLLRERIVEVYGQVLCHGADCATWDRAMRLVRRLARLTGGNVETIVKDIQQDYINLACGEEIESGALKFFKQIVNHLHVDAGLTNASVIPSGGGLVVAVPCGRFILCFDSGDATWSAEVYENVERGEFLREDLDIATNDLVTDDPADAARVITIAALKFDQEFCKL
jgi:hypothetical protein